MVGRYICIDIEEVDCIEDGTRRRRNKHKRSKGEKGWRARFD